MKLRWYKSYPEPMAQWYLCPAGRGPDDEDHDPNRDVRAWLDPHQSVSTRSERPVGWSAYVGGKLVVKHVSFREAKAAVKAALSAGSVPCTP